MSVPRALSWLNHALTHGQPVAGIVLPQGSTTGGTMDANAIFLDCPAYIDRDGTERCGLPAEVQDRYTLGSTDGAVTGLKVRCPKGHWFSGAVDALLPSLAHERGRGREGWQEGWQEGRPLVAAEAVVQDRGIA
jgi:hypothetical protein